MKLAQYLKMHRLKVCEFAKLIGRNQSSVSRYKAGKTMPGPRVMVKILRITKGEVTFNDFMRGLREKKK